MQVVALLGIGEKEEVVSIIQEFKNLSWSTTRITAIFFTDSSVWGWEILNLIIQKPSHINEYSFDQLVICGNPKLCEAMIPTLIAQFHLEEEKVIPYYKWFRFNIGLNQINWDNVYKRSDLITELQNCSTLNDCEKFYYKKQHREVTKYMHYFEIYDKYFQKYRNKECTIVEIGVFRGGSLQMWKDYFGSKAQIIGIDVVESTLQYAEEQISIKIGSQSDREFWKKFKEEYPKVDILIDDGGHTMEQQIVTFEEMFDHIAEDGIFLSEDLHTSYWKNYGGGCKNPDSFIEYSKDFIDYINAWYIEQRYHSKYTNMMHSLHYYDSVLVIEKRKMYPAVCIPMGEKE